MRLTTFFTCLALTFFCELSTPMLPFVIGENFALSIGMSYFYVMDMDSVFISYIFFLRQIKRFLIFKKTSPNIEVYILMQLNIFSFIISSKNFKFR